MHCFISEIIFHPFNTKNRHLIPYSISRPTFKNSQDLWSGRWLSGQVLNKHEDMNLKSVVAMCAYNHSAWEGRREWRQRIIPAGWPSQPNQNKGSWVFSKTPCPEEIRWKVVAQDT